MKTRLIEAQSADAAGRDWNWGKFLVGKFDEAEYATPSAVAPEHGSLLRQRGWYGPDYFLMLDIETGEGAVFRHGGLAEADLKKHAVWVCPLYQPVLEWLYKNWDGRDVDTLPALIHLSTEEAPFAMAGYRRGGPGA